MSIKINPSQMRRLHQLLNETKMMDAKADLVKEYTKGRETSSKEMLYNEANSLIVHLQSYQESFSNKTTRSSFYSKTNLDDPANRMRKKIIHYAHLMKWELPGGKADMARINAWCMKYGQYKKELNKHNEKELAHLVTQFESAYKSFLKGISNAGR